MLLLRQSIRLLAGLILCIAGIPLYSQQIPSTKVLRNDHLVKYMKADVLEEMGGKDISSDVLARHFRERFAEGYFYDYQKFPQRFEEYVEKYGMSSEHESRAKDHMSKFEPWTQWELPFKFRNGKGVDAYSYRHLARQHKMVDIAFQYFYNGKDPQYIDYFNKQKHSLNAALEKGAYEKIEAGNGAYEVFRSGYRILNWLRIHNMFLGETAYSDDEQLNTIATLLQHASHLYERNGHFRSGNHQTRGMSALAMLSLLFSDFEDADLWFDRAMKRLGEHLDKEINKDGFQFERSVHYHMSDIGNFFYVYQLAKINGVVLDSSWEEHLKSLFTTLGMIAYPDGSAPVLQDDTEIPWAEVNDISKIMTLGYVLFEDPVIGYFASGFINSNMYWYLNQDHLDMLKNIDREKPKYKSLHFPETGYYIMRQGWDEDDRMLIVTAGLDDEKPDHQHADMLGIQLFAFGHAMLPNYQVRYSLKDFDFFKNSMVKNVALVDDEMQGKRWKGNKGGSGFGKFLKLPKPKVIAWKNEVDFDLFIGSHDGFEEINVFYNRKVIFVDKQFWIVKDEFNSDEFHEYKQIWQGHYTHEEGPELIRSTFANAAGLDILQLNDVDNVVKNGRRGKEWSIVSVSDKKNYDFLTILFPYMGYSKRIDETSQIKELKGWKMNDPGFEFFPVDGYTLSKDGKHFLFGVKRITREDGMHLIFDKRADVFLDLNEESSRLISLEGNELLVSARGISGIIPANTSDDVWLALEAGMQIRFGNDK